MKSATSEEPFGYLPWIVILITVIGFLLAYIVSAINI